MNNKNKQNTYSVADIDIFCKERGAEETSGEGMR